MKTLLASLLVLATSMVAQARLIQHWTDQALLDQSDLVVIATPTSSADTPERTDLPGLTAQKVIGVETKFAVSAVVKGDKSVKNFVLHHYRADEERTGIVPNGPILIAFKLGENRKFLLFLKREPDGRYAPTVGQVDPGFQGITSIGNPVGADPTPAPPPVAAKPAPPREVDSRFPQDAEHSKWVELCLKDFEAIQVGMTRGEIEGKLAKDGGLQLHSAFRFTHPACPSFKMDVEFEVQRNPTDQNRVVGAMDDKAVKVSKPYLERPACD